MTRTNVLPIEKIEDNLRTALSLVSESDIIEGKNWYHVAYNFCLDTSKIYNIDVDVIIGMVAVLSPLAQWNYNKTLVEKILQGIEVHWKIPLNVVKARKILAEGKVFPTLSGIKVTNFYNSIKNANSEEFVVVDRWALRTAYNDYTLNAVSEVGGEKAYWMISEAFRNIASENEYLPLELQAILWVWARREFPQ